MRLANFVQKIQCCLNLHKWMPYDIQLWIVPTKNLAGYKDAKCIFCDLKAGINTTFNTKDIPPEQVLGPFSPYQITEDGILWYTSGYGPPPGFGLKMHGKNHG